MAVEYDVSVVRKGQTEGVELTVARTQCLTLRANYNQHDNN